MLSTGSSTWTSCNETPETCIVDSPSSRTKLQGSLVAQNVTVRRKRGYATEEIVPDSEEDRFRSCVEAGEVIVISSDSEQEEEEEVKAILDLDVAAQRVMSTHQSSSDSEDDDLEETPVKWTRIMSKSSRRLPAARRIIEDSESEVSEPESPVKIAKKQTVQKLLTDDIIELTSSSEDDSRPIFQPTGSSHEKPSQEMCPSYLIPQDDGAILIFDEPRSAKKPVRVSGSVPRKRSPSKQLRDVATRSNADIPAPSVPLLKSPVTFSGSSEASPNVSAPVKRKTPGTKSTKSITRVSKKALEEAERARRENYAQELFNELNRSVFKNGLPEKTKLNWNKRLLTTAGKAKYHRSRDGVETSEIELATKILDCDERIRNTLSHEMCHLATWVIDKKLDENHGKLFKHWASKVTRRRSDIEITTRHSYEISYPYKWECEKCQKIYGRYSKSIRPDECVCGACREGQLIPLFTVRNKVQTPKVSRLAAGKSYDSPCSLSHPSKASVKLPDTKESACTSHVDTEIETLTVAVAKTHIL